MPLDRGSNGAQSRLNKAVAAHEKASQEVERLMDLVENAIEALSLARKTKQQAQRELDSAALEAKREIREIAYNTSDSEGEDEEGREWSTSEVARRTGTGDRRAGAIVERSDRYEESDYSSASEESVEFDEDEESDPDDNGFDLGDSAVEQIRYRLDNAKIDLTGPEGTQVLDKLLLLLQASNEPDIDENVVNDIIDEVLCVGGEHDVKQGGDTQTDDEQPRIRINRGNKVLGWYEGALDARGYARKGKGSMYYDAGHECHGFWKDDNLIGRGLYRWSDGHVYDGNWESGKRHGLGRFIRPDGVVLFGRYEAGHHKGEGVRWSADRKEAQLVVDGVPKKSISLVKAKDIAARLGFDEELPPPVSI
mmetsp:Transcript_34272/g.77200  ORF Transcript_34272/g.77200 Transcript_34272/m.77200 type:complete len:365 (-) Transcript_34272:90-1184(-)